MTDTGSFHHSTSGSRLMAGVKENGLEYPYSKIGNNNNLTIFKITWPLLAQ
jgi:hypothetical protein